jgi:large subunit ribosomal protein L10
MKKAEKVFFVDNLKAELKDAKSVILVNYAGLAVKPQQELKSRLSEVGGKMVVIKNTLLLRAVESAGFDKKDLEGDALTGQTALIIGTDDPVAPIQVLGKFAKEFEVPKFKVGVVEGSFQNSQSLNQISNLPGRDALLSQVLGTLMGLEYGLVGTLNGNLQKLVYILDQAKNKLSN